MRRSYCQHHQPTRRSVLRSASGAPRTPPERRDAYSAAIAIGWAHPAHLLRWGPAVLQHGRVDAREWLVAVGALRRAAGLLVGSFGNVVAGILQVLGIEIRGARVLVGRLGNRRRGSWSGSSGARVIGDPRRRRLGNLQVLGAKTRRVVLLLRPASTGASSVAGATSAG